MLIQHDANAVAYMSSFHELSDHVLNLARAHAKLEPTVIFGPMRKGTQEEARNMENLWSATAGLAEDKRFAVLDLVGLQTAVDALKHRYAAEEVQEQILQELTFPLIGRWTWIHFLDTWPQSPGARKESRTLSDAAGRSYASCLYPSTSPVRG